MDARFAFFSRRLAQEDSAQLVSVKVVHGCALCLLFKTLGPGGLCPLLVNLVCGELLSDDSGRGIEGEVDLQGGEVHLLQSIGLSHDSRCWAINQDLVLVDNVDDGSNFALLGSIGQIGNTTNLYKLFERHILSCRSESSNIS